MNSPVITYIKTNRNLILILIGLFVLAALPRLLDLGSFLTADEKNWIFRSYEFIRAFKDFRFNDMLQTTHPGVTTMWVSGIAITAKMFLSKVPFSESNLIYFVKAAQFPIALLNALAIPAAYLLMRKLTDKMYLPLIAAAFMALNPFLIGYSRVIHVDALLGSLLFLAVLSTILYAHTGYTRVWLIISALFASLALLTKAPAVFIIPFFVLTVLMYEGKNILSSKIFQERFKDAVIWGLIIVISILFMWPAILWVPNPQGNVLLLKRDIGRAAVTPHNMTEDYSVNAWHYPAALITRTTIPILILSLIGIAVGVVAYLRYPVKRRRDILPLTLLIAYVFFFVIMMTLGAKKGDRYILPVFFALDALAVVGLWYIVSSIVGITKKKSVARNVMLGTSAGAILILLYLGVTDYKYHPYALAYSNSLFPDNLSQELGWGEGLEQVGAWLMQQKDTGLVASWYPEELGAYTSANVVNLSAHENPRTRYVVLYRNMFGRATDHPATGFVEEYYTKRKPVFIAKIADKEFAWVYERQPYELAVGEMLPAMSVRQEVPIIHENLAGVDVLVATYNGRAKKGDLHVQLLNTSGTSLYEWTVPISKINNDEWMTLVLPERLLQIQDKSVIVEVFATGTEKGNAPSLRYTKQYDKRSTNALIRDTAQGVSTQLKGDLSVRLRYKSEDTFYNEEEYIGQQR